MGNSISTEDDWAQSVISQLTPNVAFFAKDVIKKRVEPTVEQSLQKNSTDSEGRSLPSTAFQIEELDFGSVKPKVTNIQTHRQKAAQEDGEGHAMSPKSIVIDFDVEYSGDSNIRVKIMGIPSGVRDLSVQGRARVVLKPTTKSPPFFGGVQFCFLNDISLEFDMGGVADICDWSFIRRKIRKAIIKDATEQIVYPNKIFVPTSSGIDAMALKCFDPRGVLAVKVSSAAGLPTEGSFKRLFGKGAPDTYVTLKIGAQTYETPIVKNSTDPVWEEPQWYYFMLEHMEGFELKFIAFDDDSFSKDDFLGKAVVALETVDQNCEDEQEMTLALEDDLLENSVKKPTEVSGELNVALKWLALSSVPGDDCQMALLTVFIYSCNNLVSTASEDGIPENVLVKIAAPGGSEEKATEVKKNTQHPTFEEGFTFTLTDPAQWQEDGAIDLQVLDESSGEAFGGAQVSIAGLVESPMNRKLLSINPEVMMTTITLSAKISFA